MHKKNVLHNFRQSGNLGCACVQLYQVILWNSRTTIVLFSMPRLKCKTELLMTFLASVTFEKAFYNPTWSVKNDANFQQDQKILPWISAVFRKKNSSHLKGIYKNNLFTLYFCMYICNSFFT